MHPMRIALVWGNNGDAISPLSKGLLRRPNLQKQLPRGPHFQNKNIRLLLLLRRWLVTPRRQDLSILHLSDSASCKGTQKMAPKSSRLVWLNFHERTCNMPALRSSQQATTGQQLCACIYHPNDSSYQHDLKHALRWIIQHPFQQKFNCVVVRVNLGIAVSAWKHLNN